MKLNRIIYYIGMLSFLACVETEDFDIPQPEMADIEIVANSNLKAVKQLIDQSENRIQLFDKSTDFYVEAYVISSDAAGNFYKELIVQDKPEMPTSGLAIQIDLRSYYTKFNLGRKVWINLKGLAGQNINGKYQIGFYKDQELVPIPESLLNNHVIRSSQIEEIIPNNLGLDQIELEDLQTVIKLSNMQFELDEIGKTFAGEPYDNYDAERHLWQCSNQRTIKLITSIYTSFKSHLIPRKQGDITGILNTNYKGDELVLQINDPSNIEFKSELRCDPDYLACESGELIGEEIVFFEHFNDMTRTSDLEKQNWTNVNVHFGNERFTKGSHQGNGLVRVSAYDSAETMMEAWLVSPVIYLEQVDDSFLEFDIRAYYYNGKALTLWYTTDIDQTPSKADWHQLKAVIPVGPTNSSASEFTSSGKINLSCINQPIKIGFRYMGGDPGITTTYEIDQFRILTK